MVWFTLFLLGLAFAVWVSFWLLLALFGIGFCVVIFTEVRDFLTRKGILNPVPGVKPEDPHAPEPITIETDYQRVDSE